MSLPISLGLRVTIRQFTLFLIINAFVGSMVGLERTLLPLLAAEEFGMASHSAMLTCIAVFGLVKAVSNYYAGRFSDRWGRKKVLIIGWLFALPVPLVVARQMEETLIQQAPIQCRNHLNSINPDTMPGKRKS